MKFAARAISAYEVMTRLLHSKPPVRPVTGLSMKLVVRKVKTEAEDVVSLTMSKED